jgi:hypothetical protein
LTSNVHAGGVSSEEANMKAVAINATGGPEQLTLADVSDPVPGSGEVPTAIRRTAAWLLH